MVYKQRTIHFMTKQLLILLLVFYWSSAIGQTKIITQQPQKVPQGKKWVLTSKMQPIIEVTEGTLTLGTLCNATMSANSKSIEAIVEGNYGYPNKAYSINFSDLSTVHYTNDLTYKISSINYFGSYAYHEPEASNRSNLTAITFYPGQIVYAMGCLESIQMIETALTQNDIAELQNKKALAKRDSIAEQQANKKAQVEQGNRAKNATKEKIMNGKACDEFEIINTSNKPLLMFYDTSNLKSFIAECLLNKKISELDLSITYDTSSNPITVTKKIFSYNEYGNVTSQSDSTIVLVCSEQEILKNIKQCCRLNEPAKITFEGQTYKIPIIKDMSVKFQLYQEFQTFQSVEVRKKKGVLTTEMSATNWNIGGQQNNGRNQFPFWDTSYVEKIKEYLLSNSADKSGGGYNINCYAKRTDYRIIVGCNYNSDKNHDYVFYYSLWDFFK